ncbi:peptide ABC transporter permease [Luteitalea sp. TBR-22]|uniref:ABC transporter permease n=1 Tax=Luteitalea sp. TBR-22 TaxID=2802971 RepID=UPI001AFA17A6|nr:ABC transporter permease [Luteitalea sp. TBR-22]BCS35860.1 peptide ABC transporter permease [Luteitalea sp. TBR-22]
MRRALAGRLAFAIALVLVAFIGVYLLTGLAPGDPLDDGTRSPASVAAERVRLGMDRPLVARLTQRVARLATLDLGTSLRYGQPVLPLLVDRTARTLRAGAAALLLALALGIPAGVAASRSSSRLVRRSIDVASIVLLSLPALVIALGLAVVASGLGLSSYAVMVTALALPAWAVVARAQARALDEVAGATCLAAARARGVPAAAITWRHAWPLSLPAVLGLLGVVAGQVLSGALAIELVTARSGLGLLTFEALTSRDIDLAAGCAGTAALIVGACTLAADAVLAWVDPRQT